MMKYTLKFTPFDYVISNYPDLIKSVNISRSRRFPIMNRYADVSTLTDNDIMLILICNKTALEIHYIYNIDNAKNKYDVITKVIYTTDFKDGDVFESNTEYYKYISQVYRDLIGKNNTERLDCILDLLKLFDITVDNIID